MVRFKCKGGISNQYRASNIKCCYPRPARIYKSIYQPRQILFFIVFTNTFSSLLQNMLTIRTNPSEAQLSAPKRQVSPNRLKNTPKPNLKIMQQHGQYKRDSSPDHFLYSPQNNHNTSTSPSTKCFNHPDVPSQFYAKTVNERVGYCSKCAINLTTQGCLLLNKTTGITSKQENNTSKQRLCQLSEFLGQLKDIRLQIKRWQGLPEQINSHYMQQYELVKHFYSEAVDYISYLREEHLRMLLEEAQKHRRELQNSLHSIRDHQEDVEFIISDVQSNISAILTQLGDEDYRKCVEYYKIKLSDIQKQLDQYNQTILADLSSSTREQIEHKLQEFKSNINLMFGIQKNSGLLFSFENHDIGSAMRATTKNQTSSSSYRVLFESSKQVSEDSGACFSFVKKRQL